MTGPLLGFESTLFESTDRDRSPGGGGGGESTASLKVGTNCQNIAFGHFPPLSFLSPPPIFEGHHSQYNVIYKRDSISSIDSLPYKGYHVHVYSQN